MVLQVLMVALGGGLGSAGRFGLGLLLKGVSFWAGTLAVNLLGSLLLGYLISRGPQEGANGPMLHLALTTGFLGGFTTYSTFSVDTARLLTESSPLPAMAYAGVSVLGGVFLAYGGFILGRLP